MSVWASYPAVLLRRTPLFVALAWIVGGQFAIATILAYLTYTLFDWLDRGADTKKRRAISAWLKGQPYSRLDLKSLIIGSFDKIYGSRLVGIRGFLRASVVTLVVWAGYMIKVALNTSHAVRVAFFLSPFFVRTFPAFLLIWLFCDYASLVVIRRYLDKALGRSIFSLIPAFLIGMCFVLFSFYLIQLYFLFDMANYIGTPFPYQAIYEMLADIIPLLLAMPGAFAMIEPPLLVHVWLILFVLGAIGSRFIYLTFGAVELAQGVIKRGDEHPLRAVGLVAASVMFVTAMAWPHV